MLTELSEMQPSAEDYWMTTMSFAVRTRSNEGTELVEKEYTFSWGEEFDEWHFMEFEERRCDETDRIGARNWRTSRHVWWDSAEEPDVDVPQIVSEKLAERMDTDEVNIIL